MFVASFAFAEAAGRRRVRAPRRAASAARCFFALTACWIAAASCAEPARAERAADAAEAAWSAALAPLVLPGDATWVEAPPGLDAAAAEAALRRAGFETAVSIPPRLYVVRPTAGERGRALPAGFHERGGRGPAPAAAASRGPAVPEGAGAPPSGAEGSFDPAWRFNGLADALPPPRGAPGSAGAWRRGPAARAGSAAGAGDALPSGLFYGTRWDDLSELMLGRVAIGILFPESDGSVDPNLYDWTPSLRDSVVRSAVRGFLKWTDEAAARGVPLSFQLEIHPSIPTRYEPITRPVNQENLWIEDVLRPLVGYRGDAFAMATEFANGLRSRLGAHWAGIVFPVQNDSSSVGSFPDGLIAHARLGGPWFVIPVNNLRTTSATLDFYMEHEVTHLFWALDEFPAANAWWSCTLTTGYFDRPNLNSSIPIPNYCGVSEQCVMRGNYPDAFCLPTREQVGWADLDQDGTLDLFETPPAVIPDSSRYRTAAGSSLLLKGMAGETALPNRNPYRFYSGDSISVSTIDSIFYRVDGGPWISVPALDGVYDSGQEAFSVTAPPLPIGSHLIEWDARNRNGKPALFLATTSVTISGSTGSIDPPGTGAPAPLRLVLGPTPTSGPVHFELEGGAGSVSRVTVWTPQGRVARSWEVPSGSPGWTWDGTLRGGARAPNGVYFVTVESGRERARRRLVLVR